MSATKAATMAVEEQTRPLARHATFTVRVDTDWATARPSWEAALRRGAATPFQHPAVLDAWYAAMAGQPGVEPLVVCVERVATGEHALSLALVRTRSSGPSTIGFADDGLVDYNAPVLGPASPRTRQDAADLLRALRQALPCADLLDLRKMPALIGGRPNPFGLLGALRSPLNGNVVQMGDDWNAYHFGLPKTVRKELERSWRVFTRHPGAEFRPIVDAAERQRVLAALEDLQPVRMAATGKRYVLDQPTAAGFYRRLVAGASADEVVLTALMAGDTVVAALLGLRDLDDYVMVRISNREGEWANASPGRVIIHKTMQWLHERGQRRFDFGIGNYAYKRRFGVDSTAMIDFARPLGWRGLAGVAALRARDLVRRHPRLRRTALRLLGTRDGSPPRN